ncbi:MAG: fumarate hydratase C-terminal domain-containing protein, partial [Elusimicrobiota bacterium]|nr:fumarate hydratase C-terminal domain-containing protein [Elusimicrobiota bacterium]
MKHLTMPLTLEKLKPLKAGEEITLSGTLYSMRDKAHQEILKEAKMPLDLKGQTIYYMGPTPTRPGHTIGSCGPTTSARMDKYTPALITKTGIICIIGKGARSASVGKFLRGKAVYLIAYSGLGALIAKTVKKSEAVCYKELGAEAIY